MVEQTSGEYCDAVSEERAESGSAPTSAAPTTDDSSSKTRSTSDLQAIESDLAAVETALNRLESGTYWTDEVTGEPIPEHLLEADPLLRRAPR